MESCTQSACIQDITHQEAHGDSNDCHLLRQTPHHLGDLQYSHHVDYGGEDCESSIEDSEHCGQRASFDIYLLAKSASDGLSVIS